MSVLVTKCPQCGAALKFDAEKQSWDCQFCLGSFSIEEMDRIMAEQKQSGEEADHTEENHEFVEEMYERAETHDFSGEVRSYSCPDCGAHIVTDATTAATFCVFCHNPTIIASQLSGEFRPSKVIPFKFNKEAATQSFLKWCGKKPLVPADFKSKPQLEKLTGVYVPFWLYNCDVHGDLKADAHKVRSWRTGNYEYTETQYYEVFRTANMRFKRVPADGSSKMDDKMMDILEPYDYNQLIDFSMPYLSGYLAEKYDLDREAVFPRVYDRVQQDTITQLSRTINGYSSVRIENSQVNIRKKHADYALLPVWMLTYKHRGKSYMFAMNGQTGKVVGKLPISMKRVVAWISGIAAVVTAVLFGGGLLL